MPDLVMPRLSDSMEEGVILNWLKSEGDEVALGEELVEIETDKANMTYESDLAGTLNRIIAGEGETIPVGGPIARIGEPGEEPAAGSDGDEESAASGDDEEPAAGSDDTGEQPPAEREAEPSGPGVDAAEPKAQSADGGAASGERVKASPLARRIAREHGVDLGALEGSGPGGRVIKADVEGASEAPAAEAPAAEATAAAEPPATETSAAAPSGPAAGAGALERA
ncbi:MAG TPA: E3 binding domain-containing protein, partial [Solirubrobacterales bacterium]|nr:E3 binding domain-containing protein [Solirubrobacterales bacterium]